MSELKSFESQDDIEERRRIRQEEWEKARRPHEPEKCPEEAPVWDGKTLYQRLREQKEEKQLEWEEKYKLKNQIYKGLDEEEAKFLNVISEKRARIDQSHKKEEKKYIEAYREALQKKMAEESPPILPPRTQLPPGASNKKTQHSLIAGSIVRKRKSTGSEDHGNTFSKHSKAEEKVGETKPGIVSYGSESESDDES